MSCLDPGNKLVARRFHHNKSPLFFHHNQTYGKRGIGRHFFFISLVPDLDLQHGLAR